jgi:hypothetical protein
MPVLVRYCNKCGVRIPPLDLEIGKAIEHEGAYYCARCTEELVVVAEVVEEEEPAEEQREHRKPSAPRKHSVHVAPDRIPVRHAAKDRVRTEDHSRTEYHAPSGSHAPIYILIFGIFAAMIIIIVVLASRRETPVVPPAGGAGDQPPPPVSGGTDTPSLDTERERALGQELDRFAEEAKEGKEKLPELIVKLSEFLDRSRLPASIASRAASMRATYEEELDKHVTALLEQVTTQVRTLVEELKFGDALKVLDEFPSVFLVGDVRQKISLEKDGILREVTAHEEYLALAERVEESKKLDKPTEAGVMDVIGALNSWLTEFKGTHHTGEAEELLAGAREVLQKAKQIRREELSKKFNDAKTAAEEKAEAGEYEQAAKILRDFAQADPKGLGAEAVRLAEAYDEMAAGSEDVAPKEPKEPRFRLDFTGSDEVSTMKDFSHEAAAVKSAGNG